MFKGMIKGLKKNINLVYYIIIAVLIYLIYTTLNKKEGFDDLLAPAPAPAPALSELAMDISIPKSKKGKLLPDETVLMQGFLDDKTDDAIMNMIYIMTILKLKKDINLIEKLKVKNSNGKRILDKIDEMKKYWSKDNYEENVNRLEDMLRKLGVYGKSGLSQVPYTKYDFIPPKIFNKEGWLNKYYYSVNNLYKDNKNDPKLDKNIVYLPLLIHAKKLNENSEIIQGISSKSYFYDIKLVDMNNAEQYTLEVFKDVDLISKLHLFYYITGLYLTSNINLFEKTDKDNAISQMFEKMIDDYALYFKDDVYEENLKRLTNTLTLLEVL